MGCILEVRGGGGGGCQQQLGGITTVPSLGLLVGKLAFRDSASTCFFPPAYTSSRVLGLFINTCLGRNISALSRVFFASIECHGVEGARYACFTMRTLSMAMVRFTLHPFGMARCLAVRRTQDALERARAFGDGATSAAASRMSLTVADSTDVAVTDRTAGEEGIAACRPAVVYLDPMFPHRKKSALVKKGMQMLQGLLEEESGGRGARHGGNGGGGDGGGDGTTAEEDRRLFDVAMRLATRKVVVKRPVHGAAIVEHVAPSHAVVSKNGRFDVYVVVP